MTNTILSVQRNIIPTVVTLITEESGAVALDLNDENSPWFVAYQQFIGNGGEVAPYEAPAPAAVPTQEQQLLFDHENRLRTIEGVPTLTLPEGFAEQQPTDGS